MGRPKGSKNKSNLTFMDYTKIKPKKIAEAEKRKGRVVQPKHVLKLSEYLYITCDRHQFILKEVNTLKDKEGNPYPDICLMYATSLDGILKLAVKYMSRVPADILELSDKLKAIYDLIEARIPVDVKPRDLFEEYERNDNDEEDD